MNRRHRLSLIAVFLCLLAPGSGIAPGISQTEHWDTRKRAQSQRLTSSALNFLNERNKSRNKSNSLLDSAIALLNKAVRTDESDPAPHYLLGLCLTIKGRYEQALDTLKRAYKLDPADAEILLSTGLTQYLNGDYERAASLFDKAYSKVKNRGPVCAMLGFTFMRAGDFERAENYFAEARKQSSNSQVSYQGLAILNYLRGDLQQARNMAEQAVSLGDYPPLLLLLARIYYLEGDDAAAIAQLRDFRRSISRYKLPRSMTAIGFSVQHDFHFDPFDNEICDSPGALLARAIVDEKQEKKRASLKKQAKIDLSLALMRKRSALNARDFIAQHENGLLQMASADYKGAIESFQSALNICPNCKVDLIYLAEALEKTGAKDNARQCLEYYKKSFPGQKLAERYQRIATTSSAPPRLESSSQAPSLPGEPAAKPAVSKPSDTKDSPF